MTVGGLLKLTVISVCFLLQVRVSMKFNGQSAVEVHPHTNLEELKTVTSISLFMRVDPDKDHIEDRVILYLGDRNVRNEGKTGLVYLISLIINLYNWIKQIWALVGKT